MSSVKELLQEEVDAESLVRKAEESARTTLNEAKAKATELLKKAHIDGGPVDKVAGEAKVKVAGEKEAILNGCEARATEAEELYKKNLVAAARLVVESIAGADIEW